jgi:Fe-S-cluster containining protein
MDNNKIITIQAQNAACFRCGECCSRYQVLLDKEEEIRLSEYLDMPLGEFIGKYTDPRWPGIDRYLIKQISGKCVFLKSKGNEFLCSIHEVKPRPCQEWSPGLSRIECRSGLRKCWNVIAADDGKTISGSVYDVEAFQKFLDSLE